MQYETWLFKWLKNYVTPTSKPRTAEIYEKLIRLHIIPYLGETELDALTPEVLQNFVAEMMTRGNRNTGKGLSSNTVNAIISVIQNSLKAAMLAGKIPTYTADSIRRPAALETQVDCFSIGEQKILENAILESKKNSLFGIVLCLYTGLRIGELLALEWSDVDFETGLLFVTKTCHYGHEGRVVDSPKTPSSRRIIPLPRQLLPLLIQHKKHSRSIYVVANGEKPISIRSYQRTFMLLQRRLGLPHRRFHALRHTFATRALECGMDVKTLSEIMGHKSSTVTLNRYAHSMMEHKKDMMNRVGKML